MEREVKSLDRDELFIDTTYLFPFLQVPIDVNGFKLSDFRTLIRRLSRIHTAELSVYEAKAKLLRLSRTHRGYEQVLQSFGSNLDALRNDEKFVFHSYEINTDQTLNRLRPITKGLDPFDLIVLSQALQVGELLTEDRDLLSLRESTDFAGSELSARVRIRNWRNLPHKDRFDSND